MKQSSYGLGTTDIQINDSSEYYTGSGNGVVYKTNTAQSTTGNIYGIYDLSGGAWEYVMGNMVDSNEQFYISSSGFSAAPNERYYDKYTYNTSDTTHERGKLGDATKETLSTTGTTSGGWYGDYSIFLKVDSHWIRRGGNYNVALGAGIFSLRRGDGSNNSNSSTRAVLTP